MEKKIIVNKGFKIEGAKAVYNRKSKAYDVLGDLEIKARLYSNVKVGDRVIFTCKGCAVVATKSSSNGIALSKKAVKVAKWNKDSAEFLETINNEKAKALRKYLLTRLNLKDMKWDNLVAKCEVIPPKTAKAVENVLAKLA